MYPKHTDTMVESIVGLQLSKQILNFKSERENDKVKEHFKTYKKEKHFFKFSSQLYTVVNNIYNRKTFLRKERSSFLIEIL